MTNPESVQQARHQALRLQRFYLAQLSYLISYVVIAATWATGNYLGSNAMMLSHFILGLLSQGLLLAIFKSGLNLRFRDPSLTSPQMIVALLLQTYLLALVGEIRGTVLAVYCLILLFGVFQLSRRAYLVHAGLALACYASLILINQYLGIYPQRITVALLELFVLACFLLWVSMVGSYIRELRGRLRQRHTTLQQHQDTLRSMMGQLQSLAATDALTGLPNRRFFIDEARRRNTLLERGQTMGVAMIDLDHFKRINDLHGHSTGDKVLQEFARIARDNLRGKDMVARFGGEEFVLLLDNCDLATLHHCVERIRQGLASHFFSTLPDGVRCTLSAGICLIHPEDDLDWRLKQADEALYRAKAEGRNRTRAHEAAYS